MFATEVTVNLSDAATCVDYDDESVCIIMKGNGKGIHWIRWSLTYLFLQNAIWVCSILNPSPWGIRICPTFANSVDPDQLAPECRSVLFAIKYVNLYQQSGSRIK